MEKSQKNDKKYSLVVYTSECFLLFLILFSIIFQSLYSITKATDSFEYEVEDKQTTTSLTSTTTGGNSGMRKGPEGEFSGGERDTTINIFRY